MRSEDAERLCELIKKAIRDCEVSTSEYNEIQKLAAEDGEIDPQERALLSQLQQMLADGSIERVAG